MNKQTIIGIDNGTTGTIAIYVGKELVNFILTPAFVQQSYTHEINNISRIDVREMVALFSKYSINSFAVLERPMSDPTRYNSSMIALRAYEATLIALELCGIKSLTIDSKRWQRHYLKGSSGAGLKHDCAKLAIKLYPQYTELIENHGDADAIFIAKSVIDGVIAFNEKQKVKKPKQKIKEFSSNT